MQPTEITPTDAQAPYQNPALPAKDRAADLVSRMTLEEKVSQMGYDAPAIERLSVPRHNWWNECLHGVGRAGGATVFPQAIGLAAAWNPDLMGRIATAISDEARAKHHEAVRRGIRQIYTGLTFWTPNINIFRDPRWGRGQETYGEDPHLTARLAVAFIKGLQGEDPRYLKLVATAKHYAVHSGPEAGRHHFDVRVSHRDLWDTYLPAFEACVKEAGVVSVMGAYNRVNGEPACASPTLLQEILRQQWAFDGYVVSDCWAIKDIYLHHQVVATAAEAAALAARHGCDLNCGDTYPALLEAVEKNLISEQEIDQAVTRLFEARIRLGVFDPPEQVPYTRIPFEVVNSPAHQALALQAARQSMVLLKNEGNLLPLSKDIGSIAVIGPNADDLAALLGNYNGTPATAITPLDGIRQKLSPSTRIYYAPGCEIAPGVPPLTVIPPACLRPDSPDAGVNGLTAAYFDKSDFRGDPARLQIDPTIDFIWKGVTPLTGAWGDHFAARWSGYLVPPVSGVYQLGVSGFSAYKFYLDDDLFLAYSDVHHPVLRRKEIELEGGRLYRLRIEYINHGIDPQIRLFWAVPGIDYVAQAIEAAKKAEVVVMAMGLSPNLEGEEMPVQVPGFAGGDRTDISLPGPQEALLKQIHALGKPVALALLNGSALAINWAAAHVPAIIEAWYPGQAGGQALADVLFGDYNPAGRLPVTFYQSVDDLPPFDDYRMAGHTYRYFEGQPLFSFGYGLSYTTFAYNNLRLSSQTIDAAETLTVSVDVTNTGARSGDEVVQLYVRDVEASVARPLKDLKGFQRIGLEAGETKTVTFILAAHQLGFYNKNQAIVVEPGEFEIMVGGSSDGIHLRGKVEVAYFKEAES